MAKIVSRHTTKIAYDLDFKLDGHGTPVGTGQRVEIAPGDNYVDDATAEKLMAPVGLASGEKQDSEMARHAQAGYIEVLAGDAPEAPVPADEPAPADPRRDRKPKESDKVYKTRMDALDAEDAKSKEADDKLVTDYLAMSPEERAATYGALDAREQTLVDAAVANG